MSEASSASAPDPVPEKKCPSCEGLWEGTLTMCPDCAMDLIPVSGPASTTLEPATVASPDPEAQNTETLAEGVRWHLTTPHGMSITLEAGSDQYVGRDVDNCPSAGALINYLQISRMHCRIRATLEELIVEDDYPSTNGVFVNGQRVQQNQPVSVRAGDQLRLAQDVPLQITRTSDAEPSSLGKDLR